MSLTIEITSPNISIRRLLEIAEIYAKEQEWSNAEWVLFRALDRIYKENATSGRDLEVSNVLKKMLRTMSKSRKLRGRHIRCGGQIDQLRRSLIEIFKHKPKVKNELANSKFATVFQSPASKVFTIAFYQQDMSKFKIDDAKSPFSVVTPKVSVSFLVWKEGCFWRVKLIEEGLVEKLSYGWAHLARASVLNAIAEFRLGPILNGEGKSTILSQARYYWWALVLRPDYAWAYAHFGEVFRDVANSIFHKSPFKRGDYSIKCYVKSLYYYNVAIKRYKRRDSFWAYAHFGAAIANMRAFVGDNVPDLVKQIVEELEESGVWKLSNEYPSLNLINMGLEALMRAQDLRGNLYPWAHKYYAGSILIKGIINTLLDNDAPSLGYLSTISTSNALYMDPDIALEVFEAGQLYVNGFFEMGILCLAAKKNENERYSEAWQYVTFGMSWTFKSPLLPGLEELMGANILAHIALYYVQQHKKDPVNKPPKSALLGQSRFKPNKLFPISCVPIYEEKKLLDFIERSLGFIEQSVITYTSSGVKRVTAVEIGLQATWDLLFDFLCIVRNELRLPDSKPLNQRLIRLLQRINPKYNDERITEMLKELKSKYNEEYHRKHVQNVFLPIFQSGRRGYEFSLLLDQHKTK
ncbi:MAG: hypothetical protein AAGF11_07450 [Myxococcota bacterium]